MNRPPKRIESGHTTVQIAYERRLQDRVLWFVNGERLRPETSVLVFVRDSSYAAATLALEVEVPRHVGHLDEGLRELTGALPPILPFRIC